MRKLIMWNFITLDGYFEGTSNWDLSFHEVIWGPELEKFSIDQGKTADNLIFGRVTYEGMAAHWTKAEGEIARFMNEIPKIVFSRTLRKAGWNNSTLLQGNVRDEILRLKAEGEGNMLVFGSAILSETLIKENLYDEYRIGIAPVFLGDGRPLFSKGISGKLQLLTTHQLSNGGVILTYKPLNS